MSPEEEASDYIRTRAFQSIANLVDETTQLTFQTAAEPLVRDLQSFFRLTSPNDCLKDDYDGDDTASPRKKPRTEDDSPHAIFAVEQPTRYNTTLFPVALCHPPASLLDRSECVASIIKTFRSTSNRTAVCCLRNVASSVSRLKHCGPLVSQILLQCIDQDSDRNRFESLRNKLSNRSAAERLLLWAQNTESFESIVVVLPETEELSALLLRQLIHLLATLRSEWGLPVQLVVMVSPQTQTLWDSTAQGTGGVMARNFWFPSSQHMHGECTHGFGEKRQVS